MKPYYEQDGITIYHGDALEIMPLLPRVSLALTDPPFFLPAQHYASRSEWSKAWGDTSILSAWWGLVLDALPLRGDGSVVTFCDGPAFAVFFPEFYRRFPAVRSLVWDKGSIGMGQPWRHQFELLIVGRQSGSKWTGSGGESDVLRCPVVPSESRFHPVDKPTALLGQILRPLTDPDDLILDPFLGGGSTLIAAKENGRKAIGIEIEERYCELAAKRLAQGVLAFGE